MSETQLLWMFTLSLLGSVAAIGMLWWGKMERVVHAGRVLGALGLVFGVLVAAAIAFGDGAALVITSFGEYAQPLFYGMPIALDRFAAIFFVVASLVGIGVAHVTDARKAAQAIALTVAAQLVMVSGSVLGFMFFWFPMLVFAGNIGRVSARWRGAWMLSGLAILSGWFLLTGGALFNDFQTIGFAAVGLGPWTLRVAFGLLFLGFVVTGLSAMHIRNEGEDGLGSVVAGAVGGAALYGFLRMALFVMPTTYGVVGEIGSLLLVGVAIWNARGAWRARQTHELVKRLIASQGALVFAGLTFALFAVSLEAWSLMNLVLFATIMLYLAHGAMALGLGRCVDWTKGFIGRGDVHALGGLAQRAPWVALAILGLLSGCVLAPGTVSVVVSWMTVHGLIEALNGYGRSVGVFYLIYLLGFTSAVAALSLAALRALGRLLSGELPEHLRDVVLPDWRETWVMAVGAGVTVMIGVGATTVLADLGAEPLLANARSIGASITTVSGAYLPVMSVVLVAGFAGAAVIARHYIATGEGADRAAAGELPPTYIGRGVAYAKAVVAKKLPKFKRV